MPIPAFDGILNVLPPHLGVVDGFVRDMSPYECTVEELCDRFATSPARKQILAGILDFRAELRALGIQGYQWLGGSFVENIERQEERDPRDLDVVTFTRQPADADSLAAILTNRPELFLDDRVRERYPVDHFWIPLATPPEKLVELSCFRYGLYSHRTKDQVWKGMLKIELTDQTNDDAARVLLEGKP